MGHDEVALLKLCDWHEGLAATQLLPSLFILYEQWGRHYASSPIYFWNIMLKTLHVLEIIRHKAIE